VGNPTIRRHKSPAYRFHLETLQRNITSVMALKRIWHGACKSFRHGRRRWAACNGAETMTASVTTETPLPLRNDTILGVCEALGQDFGFNPLWLRLAFIAPLFFVPLWTIAGYLGLGALVAVSRKLYPRTLAASPATDLVAADRAVEREYKIAA
jgi:phage shock protein C